MWQVKRNGVVVAEWADNDCPPWGKLQGLGVLSRDIDSVLTTKKPLNWHCGGHIQLSYVN